tara:strand:+ start:59 stop:661 length:603 start_codon:yes stop_codon:yes gene_type:complete
MDYAEASGGLIKIEGIIPEEEVEFYAFITSFSDSMNSNWNEEQVYGRPDPIGTFQNTTRKISLAFDVPAGDIIEAKINLKFINQVKQFMYPAYSSNTENNTSTNALSLAKSPLVRIKFANLIQNGDGKGLLGWIGSFSATPVIDMGMFNESKNGQGMLYPKVYNVSLDFTPQHEFDLGYVAGTSSKIDEKFTKFPYDGGE